MSDFALYWYQHLRLAHDKAFSSVTGWLAAYHEAFFDGACPSTLPKNDSNVNPCHARDSNSCSQFCFDLHCTLSNMVFIQWAHKSAHACSNGCQRPWLGLTCLTAAQPSTPLHVSKHRHDDVFGKYCKCTQKSG